MSKENANSTTKAADASSSAQKELLPYVANVLKDRSIHDLMKEKNELKKTLYGRMMLNVRILKDGCEPVVYDSGSLGGGWILEDNEGDEDDVSFGQGKIYLCADCPPIMIGAFGEETEIVVKISIGGVTVFESAWLDMVCNPKNTHHLVKGIILAECYHVEKPDTNTDDFDYILVGIFLDTEMMPGIMEVLEPYNVECSLDSHLDDVCDLDDDWPPYPATFFMAKVWKDN